MRPPSPSCVGLLLLSLFAACNKPPEGTQIHLEPDPATTTDDLEVVFDAEAEDPNRRDEVRYTWRWLRDGEEMADYGEATLPAAATAKGETWTVEVTPSDENVAGETASASVAVVNTPPALTVTFEPEAPLASEDVTAVVTIDDPDGDEVTSGCSWERDGEPTDHDTCTLPAEDTTRGEVWTVTATAADDEEEAEPVQGEVSIENVPPEVTAIVVSPDPIQEESEVTAEAETWDEDGDPVSVTWTFTVDDTVVQEGEGATLTGEWFDRDQELVVTATPHDGFVEGEPLSTEPITVANTPPTVETATVSPSEVYEATEVTCEAGGLEDADGDAADVDTTWWVNGLEVGWSDTLDGDSFDKGDAITCGLTPWDDIDEGERVDSDPVVVLNTAPVLVGASISPSAPSCADTLEIELDGSSDDDGDTVTWDVTWYVDGTEVATTDTLSGSTLTRGQAVQAVVVPYDGSDYGSAVTTAEVTVVNAPPEVTSLSISPETAYTDTTIGAEVETTDADGDTVSLSYTWYVDGTATGSGEATLDGDLYFERDAVVYVEVTPDDGSDTGAAETSDSITIQNSPPTAPGVEIDPEAPYEGQDDLLCLLVTESTDADDDALDYAVSWKVNGADYTPPDDPDVVPAEDTEEGQNWTCTVTPSDPIEDGDPGEATVEILGDDAGPTLTVDEPDRGTFLEGYTGTVSGTATDDISGVASVSVGGTDVTVDSDGSFSTSATYDFGLNVVETVATDGQGNETTDTRAVLAGDFYAYDSAILSGVLARLDEGAGGLEELEVLGEDLVAATDLDALIPSPVYEEEEEDCVDMGWIGEYCFTWYAVELYVTNPSIGDNDLELDPLASGQLLATFTVEDPSLDWSASGVVAEISYSGSGDITADAITVDLYLTPYVSGNELYVDVDSVSVSTSGFDFDWDSWLQDAVDYFGVDVDGWVQGYMEDAMEEALEDELPDLIADTLQDLEISEDIEALDHTWTFYALPGDVDVDANGITLALDTEFTVDTWEIDLTGSGSLYYGYSEPTWSGGDGTVMAVGDDFLNQALYAFWGAGVLDVAYTAEDLGLDTSEVSAYLGVEEITLETEAMLPPTVIPGSGSNLLELQVGDLSVALYEGDTTSGGSGDLFMELYVTAFADLELSVSSDDTLSPTIGDVTVYVDLAWPDDGSLESAETFIEAALPSFLDAFVGTPLGEVPIPDIEGYTLTGIAVDTAGAEDGYVTLGGTLSAD